MTRVARRVATSCLLAFFFLLPCFFCDEEVVDTGKLYKIEGRVYGEGADSTVTLHGNGGRLSVLPATNGKFELTDIPAGAYVLEIVSNKYVYSQVRVDVSARQGGKVKAKYEESNRQIPYPLELHPQGPIVFFEERKSFELSSFLKNPMVIMVVLPLAVMFLTKTLTSSDAMKQQLAEMNGNQPAEKDPTDIVHAWLDRDGKRKRRE